MRRRAGGCALLIVTRIDVVESPLNVCNRVKRYAPLTYRFDTRRPTDALVLSRDFFLWLPVARSWLLVFAY